jgi:hypothetical protein
MIENFIQISYLLIKKEKKMNIYSLKYKKENLIY